MTAKQYDEMDFAALWEAARGLKRFTERIAGEIPSLTSTAGRDLILLIQEMARDANEKLCRGVSSGRKQVLINHLYAVSRLLKNMGQILFDARFRGLIDQEQYESGHRMVQIMNEILPEFIRYLKGR